MEPRNGPRRDRGGWSWPAVQTRVPLCAPLAGPAASVPGPRRSGTTTGSRRASPSG